MQNEVDKDIADLVIARLQTLPDDLEISVGAEGTFTKDELIAHVREGDEVGKEMIKLEMNFLCGLKDGILYDDNFAHHSAEA